MILRALAFATALTVALTGSPPAAAQPQPTRPAAADPAFQKFIAELWKDAQAKGISRQTFNLAFAGVTPDPRVIAQTTRQPEQAKPMGAYVASLAAPQRAAAGLRKEAEWRAVFEAEEKRFKVERWIILAIWGMETSYGALKDRWDTIRSLASLAYARYRGDYFRNELLIALQILQAKHVTRDRFVSSWAGAMGQTQFMPKNFMDYAIDFSGDGRPDIWTNVPDVIGSTGNYLSKEGWKWGLPWGFEVLIPQGFDYRKSRAAFGEWTRLGVKRADGKAYPAGGEGILFFPTGLPGPAFIITENYHVLREYNNSDAYAISIGHLADRMRGGAPFKTAWPKHNTTLPRDDRIALQKRLAALGHDVKLFNGPITFEQRDFIRAEQVKLGMLPDGHASAELLDRMGIKRK
jgi:membrane-bound lytic murein transglycosylase B